jgi:threonine dehydratase
MSPTPRLAVERIEAASRSIDPVFLNSPQFLSEPLSDQSRARVVLKVETVNPIRSFKGRGADLFVSTVKKSAQLVTASAGNFGQAIAYAARKRGVKALIFAAERANPYKIERMRALGADVRLAGNDFDAAKAAAHAYAEEHGGMFVEDGREAAISEGQGTIAVELGRWPEKIDYVVCPLGNGALLAGIGTVIKARSNGTRVIGVCATGAPAMERSWKNKKIETTASVDTVADGIGVRVPIPEALEDLASLLDDIVLVEDRAMIEAVRFAFRHHGLVTEPAGVAGIAAILSEGERFRGATVATPICGGNIDPQRMKDWLS